MAREKKSARELAQMIAERMKIGTGLGRVLINAARPMVSSCEIYVTHNGDGSGPLG
jgi:hypothetical protein